MSDVDFMARTHALTKTQVTLIYGSFAAMHTIRIARDPKYANFFARQTADGRIDSAWSYGFELVNTVQVAGRTGRRVTGDLQLACDFGVCSVV